MFIKPFVFMPFYTSYRSKNQETITAKKYNTRSYVSLHFEKPRFYFLSHFLQISLYLYIKQYSLKHVILIKKWISSTHTCHDSCTIMDKIKTLNKQFLAISILNFIFALPFLFRFKRKKRLFAAWFLRKFKNLQNNTNIKIADSACST